MSKTTNWLEHNCRHAKRHIVGLDADVRSQSRDVAKIFRSIPMLKFASVENARQAIHLYVDPALAANYDINLHLAEAKGEARTVLAEKTTEDFLEKTTTFASRTKRDPSYLC